MSTGLNRPIIFEISTDSADELEKFYQSVFPWRLSPTPEGEYKYKFIATDGFEGNVGGIWSQSGHETNWSLFGMMVDGPALDDVVAQIVAEGGEITWPVESHEDEHGVLRGGQFRDPSGNLGEVFSFTPST